MNGGNRSVAKIEIPLQQREIAFNAHRMGQPLQGLDGVWVGRSGFHHTPLGWSWGRLAKQTASEVQALGDGLGMPHP